MSGKEGTFGLYDDKNINFNCEEAASMKEQAGAKLFQLSETHLRALFPDMSQLTKQAILSRLAVLLYDKSQRLSIQSTLLEMRDNLCQ